MSGASCLVLRLVGPLQSWGTSSQFNRRETDNAPSKSGVIGLLAAADGRRRNDPIADLVGLHFGVRVDQPGSLLRDYHTVSDVRGRPLLSAAVDSKGRQKRTSPPKYTGVTQRFYLQDASFVAIVEGDRELLSGLAEALVAPTFPLALGRRSCAPAAPPLVAGASGGLWEGPLHEVLRQVPWQATSGHIDRLRRAKQLRSTVRLAATLDAEALPEGGDGSADDVRADLPSSFDPLKRSFGVRTVRHTWVDLPTGVAHPDIERRAHDPFEILGW